MKSAVNFKSITKEQLETTLDKLSEIWEDDLDKILNSLVFQEIVNRS